jgi:MFS family permease
MDDASIQTSPSTNSPPAAPHGTTPRAAMFIVFLVVFIDLLGFGIVLPLLPLYGDRYLEKLYEGGKESATGGAILGLLMSSFSLMQFLFAPVWGRISDRVGRRPILLIGLVGSAVFYCLLGYASDISPEEAPGLALALLFVARIGAGVSGATIATAQAVIADCTPPDKRKHGMALIGAAFGIGFTFGPLLGAGSLYVFKDHPGVTGYAATVLSLTAFVLGFILLPETRRFSEAGRNRRWFDGRAIVNALANPAIGPVVLCFFLASLGFGGFESTLSMINQDALDLPREKNFFMFAYVGFVLMLSQGLLYRRLAHRVSEPTFMLMGLLLMGVGVSSLACVSYLAINQQAGFGVLLSLMMVCMTVSVIGFSFLTPSAQALVSRRGDPEKQGEILGVNQSAAAMARILGPIIALTLYKATANHLLPYLFGGGVLLLMVPLIPRIRRGGPAGS